MLLLLLDFSACAGRSPWWFVLTFYQLRFLRARKFDVALSEAMFVTPPRQLYGYGYFKGGSANIYYSGSLTVRPGGRKSTSTTWSRTSSTPRRPKSSNTTPNTTTRPIRYSQPPHRPIPNTNILLPPGWPPRLHRATRQVRPHCHEQNHHPRAHAPKPGRRVRKGL